MLERDRPKAPLWAKLFLFFGLLLLYFPLGYLLIGSFVEKTPDGPTLTLKWYVEILHDTEIWASLGRSGLVAILNAAISVVIGSCAALAIHRSGFRFKKSLQALSLLTLVLPELVFALALMSWFALLKWPLSLMTVTVAHVTFSLSFVLLTVSSRLTLFENSHEEAAKDLGARDWQILLRIYFPFLKSALFTSFLFCLILSFDDFLITYFTNGVGSDTLPIKLFSSLKMGHSPKLNALSCLMIGLTGALVIVFMRRKIYRDLLR